MKILFINGHLNTGGVEKSLIDILTHIDTEKYEVDLLLLEELGDYAPLLPPQIHIKLCSLKNTYGPLGPALLRCIREKDWFCLKMKLIFLAMKLFGTNKISLAKKMLTNKKYYDYVIGFRPGICTQIASYAVNANQRITWWHYGLFNTDAVSYWNEVKSCDQIVAVSNACRNFLEEEIPSISEKLITVPNMLDVTSVQQKATIFHPYKDGEKLYIVSVGGLVPEKHFENAIFAAKRLKEHGLTFCWHLLGDGPMRSELESQVQKTGLSDCFIFEGNQPNPYPYMNAADLFIHPSYVESQGLTILEAMALGVPCVVTKSLGPCEFIEDGVNGILTEQSPESLSEKVLEILTDRQLYEKIKAHTACPEAFRPETVMKKIEALLGG